MAENYHVMWANLASPQARENWFGPALQDAYQTLLENKCVLLHCFAGRHRVGAMAALLQARGVKESGCLSVALSTT